VADARLEADLHELIALLDTYNEKQWSGWFSESLQHIQADDAYGLEHLLRAYGGTGSFNDLVIDPNGHPIDADTDAVNRQLRALAETINLRASALLRELGPNSV
jgi:hypothetical protein